MSNTNLPKSAPLITLGVTQLGSVIINLLAAFGAAMTVEQVGAVGGAVSFLGVVLAFVLWAFTVSSKEVVEKLIGTEVVAGEANDIVPAGRPIREISSPE